MRENPLGGKAGHADQEVQSRADREQQWATIGIDGHRKQGDIDLLRGAAEVAVLSAMSKTSHKL
jgi:hypothetical protein